MHFATTPDEVRAVTDAAIAEADGLVAAAVATGGAGSFEAVLLPFDEADARLAAGYAGGRSWPTSTSTQPSGTPARRPTSA